MASRTYVTNVKEKASLFNEYFAKQCTPLDDDPHIPQIPVQTNNKISYFYLNPFMVHNLILKFNSKKSSGPDEISIRMLQLCPQSMSTILYFLYANILESGHFPNSWKIANVQPVHKKGSRQSIDNYRPISLLPVCSKILEKIIFDQIYSFLFHKLI